ncbi:MAG TPA: cupin domain-containing protein [Candidatus Angelobacter sp.]|nr:cupin domain-containing protein [Candidatus Angelobacter sp.]
MSLIDVVRSAELGTGYSTAGIIRKMAFESENVIFSQSRLLPGVVSGWHHHGTHHLYGYIVSGRLQLEYGIEGEKKADLNSGDFFHVPPSLVHRDINPNGDRDMFVVNILVGTGPAVINVDSPSRGD